MTPKVWMGSVLNKTALNLILNIWKMGTRNIFTKPHPCFISLITLTICFIIMPIPFSGAAHPDPAFKCHLGPPQTPSKGTQCRVQPPTQCSTGPCLCSSEYFQSLDFFLFLTICRAGDLTWGRHRSTKNWDLGTFSFILFVYSGNAIPSKMSQPHWMPRRLSR